MKKQFTMTRDEVIGASAESLKAEIHAATHNESATASILRSLERMGTDPSIEYYEVTCVENARTRAGDTSSSWRVRADRGAPPAVME